VRNNRPNACSFLLASLRKSNKSGLIEALDENKELDTLRFVLLCLNKKLLLS
jgi:hypothetical protein